MVRALKCLAAGLLAGLLGFALILAAAIEGWGRRPLAPQNDQKAFAAAMIGAMDRETKGNAALVLIDAGKIYGEHFVSKGEKVDRDTQFQVASLSKAVTAWGVMSLVDQGKVDLDKPVSTYLKRWKLPPSQFDNNKVTVRRLLSHTAGLTDGLGYGGFKPGEPVQSLEASLTKASDASPGRKGAVQVGQEPGEFAYSGGGYTLLQLLIEEVSGQSFNSYMTETVFKPLGMTRSTYVLGNDTTNVAESYNTDGSKGILYNFSALAAASLYTSAADMTRFIAAHTAGPNGEAAGRGVLRPQTLVAMRQPIAKQYGADIWGMGTILYAPNNRGDNIIGHDGDNEPAINTTVRLDPASGDGIVVLETGNKRLATQLGGEWVFWSSGNVDFLTVLMQIKQTLLRASLLAGLAFLAAFVWVWRVTRPKVAAA